MTEEYERADRRKERHDDLVVVYVHMCKYAKTHK